MSSNVHTKIAKGGKRFRCGHFIKTRYMFLDQQNEWISSIVKRERCVLMDPATLGV